MELNPLRELNTRVAALGVVLALVWGKLLAEVTRAKSRVLAVTIRLALRVVRCPCSVDCRSGDSSPFP